MLDFLRPDETYKLLRKSRKVAKRIRIILEYETLVTLRTFPLKYSSLPMVVIYNDRGEALVSLNCLKEHVLEQLMKHGYVVEQQKATDTIIRKVVPDEPK